MSEVWFLGLDDKVSIPFGWGVGANLIEMIKEQFKHVSIPFGWGVGANVRLYIF